MTERPPLATRQPRAWDKQPKAAPRAVDTERRALFREVSQPGLAGFFGLGEAASLHAGRAFLLGS